MYRYARHVIGHYLHSVFSVTFTLFLLIRDCNNADPIHLLLLNILNCTLQFYG